MKPQSPIGLRRRARSHLPSPQVCLAKSPPAEGEHVHLIWDAAGGVQVWSASPTIAPRWKCAYRSRTARMLLPKPCMRRSSQCLDHWRRKRPRMKLLLACCFLRGHACRSCTAHNSPPTLYMPQCSTLLHWRCRSLRELALGSAKVEVRTATGRTRAKAEGTMQAAVAEALAWVEAEVLGLQKQQQLYRRPLLRRCSS